MAKANLGRGKTMSKLVAVDGVSPGDVASASHDKVGLSLVQLGANVPSKWMVQVMLTNQRSTTTDSVYIKFYRTQD